MDSSENKKVHSQENQETEIEYKDAPNVYLYVANILDYIRLIVVVIGFYLGKTHPNVFLITYFISFACDALDGYAARLLKQCSRLGGSLDMIIDRISTAGLLMLISQLYPSYSEIFIFLMMLDIGSHWLQTTSAMIGENSKQINHKNLKEPFLLLDLYYKQKWFMFPICLFAEIYLLILYYAYFHTNMNNCQYCLAFNYICLFFYALKQFLSFLQIISAAQRIVKNDIKEYFEVKKVE